MNVKNDVQALQQILSSQQVGASGNAKTQGSGTAESAGADEATLSSVASLASQASSVSDVRMEKVNQVQQALAAGTYSVPSTEVADSMIDHMLGK